MRGQAKLEKEALKKLSLKEKQILAPQNSRIISFIIPFLFPYVEVCTKIPDVSKKLSYF